MNVIAQPRSEIDFNKGWKFFLGDDILALAPAYNDVHWRSISLPHDWSIESDFIKDTPATNQSGSLPGDIGWYRKTFALPQGIKSPTCNIIPVYHRCKTPLH